MPRRAARAVSLFVITAWIVTMGVVLNRTYLQARSFNLATDLAQYGSTAEWRGVYYRGEKIGFTVRQTHPMPDGFRPGGDGRPQECPPGDAPAATMPTTPAPDSRVALPVS